MRTILYFQTVLVIYLLKELCVCVCVCVCVYIYTGCPRRNVPDFGRVFLMLKYTDITQNTYVQSIYIYIYTHTNSETVKYGL